MKVSEKEIKLLVLLLVVLAAFVFFNFGVKPQKQAADDLKANVDTVAENVRITSSGTADYERDAEKIRSKSQAILANITHFYTKEQQEELLNQVDRWLTDSGLTYVTVSPQMPNQQDLSYENEDGWSVSHERITVLWSPITIEAKGKYDDVMKLLTILSNAEKYSIAYQMSVDMSSESIAAKSQNPDVRLNISLYFLNLKNPNLYNAKSGEELYPIPVMPPDKIVPDEVKNGQYGQPLSLSEMISWIGDKVTNWGA